MSLKDAFAAGDAAREAQRRAQEAAAAQARARNQDLDRRLATLGRQTAEILHSQNVPTSPLLFTSQVGITEWASWRGPEGWPVLGPPELGLLPDGTWATVWQQNKSGGFDAAYEWRPLLMDYDSAAVGWWHRVTVTLADDRLYWPDWTRSEELHVLEEELLQRIETLVRLAAQQ